MQTLEILKSRFLSHPHRHPNISWDTVEAKLMANREKLAILEGMEETGGEPDVVELGDESGEIIFVDCSVESPSGRRSLCYDRAALDARKENKPKNSVDEMAKEIGIYLLNEKEYRALQVLDTFDTKTSSWVATPENVRQLSGALFCDRRYDTIFLYHNGADSYYAARGFRGKISI